ncbi:MAG: YhjD/YihY/BrkB family envelope integrity protein [Desulfobaccales bacterium]
MPHETPAPAPRKRRPPLRPVWDLLSETYRAWRRDNAPTLGAALAFYTTFSMAPLLIIVIAIFGVILGKTTVQVEILRRAQDLIGAQGAGAVRTMIEAAYRPGTGLAATLIGILVIKFIKHHIPLVAGVGYCKMIPLCHKDGGYVNRITKRYTGKKFL